MSKCEQGMPTKTLFNPVYQDYLSCAAPYHVAVQLLQDGDDPQFPMYEADIFAQVLEHEIAIYETRGLLAGEIELHLEGSQTTRSAVESELVLPNWVEADGLAIAACNADGVLLIENPHVFKLLVAEKAWVKLGLVLATGFGVPRYAMRRFLHRVSVEEAKPIYLFADNDTWGYFIYSVLKRGLLGPHESCPYLAIENLRYLGLRAGDIESVARSSRKTREWAPRFDLRLRYLEGYECFRDMHWRNELSQFVKLHYAVEARWFVEELGVEMFVQEYLLERITHGRWLD